MTDLDQLADTFASEIAKRPQGVSSSHLYRLAQRICGWTYMEYTHFELLILFSKKVPIIEVNGTLRRRE